MTEPLSPEMADLPRLIDAVCVESATDDQILRLEDLLASDPAARAFYLRSMELFADLRTDLAPLPGLPFVETAAAPAERPFVSRWRIAAALAVLATIAAVLLSVVVRPKTADAPPTGPGRNTVSDVPAAVLARSVRAEWGETDLPTLPGSNLRAGKLSLKFGLARIDQPGGITVVLEGPVELRVNSHSEVFCELGKLRVVVPAAAGVYTVGTPHLDVVARGAEFAVRVDAAGWTEVHVIRGTVELRDRRSGAETPPRELPAGRAERVSAAGPPAPAAADPEAFASDADLDAAAVPDVRRQEAWRTAIKGLAADPSALVLYPFDEPFAGDRILHDARPQSPRDGIIGRCEWAEGRWPGKRALAFNGDSSRVVFSVPGAYDSLTLAAWVRADKLPRRFNALMMTDNWKDYGLHWQVQSDGEICLGVQNNRDRVADWRVHNYVTPRSEIGPDRLGRWVHLAVVYDGDKSRTVSHYLDGVPVARLGQRMAGKLRIGDAELGNWTLKEHHTDPDRGFAGRMDEFAAFGRALSDEEIGAIYRAGRPGPRQLP